MTDPRNIAHDKRVHQEKKQHGIQAEKAASRGAFRPGKKPHTQPQHEPANLPGGHGPDLDEPIDKTESGEEP